MQFYYNLEIEFPIVESVGIKGVIFHDGGNLWNLEKSLCGPAPMSNEPAIQPCGVAPTTLRTSVGFGFRWFSPLGPLRFEWGFPLAPKRPAEDTYQFQFTVGNAF
jgi:outer membrane protein insertion porin family